MTKYVVFGAAVFFLFLLIILISTLASKKKNKDKEDGSSGTGKIKKSIAELLPIYDFDNEHNCYKLKEDRYMDLLQINSKDLINSSADEVEYDCLKFAKMYKLYEDDIKIVTMNFPCDTKVQQKYMQHRIDRTANNVYKQFLQKKLDELVWLGKNNTTREFYYMIFADSLDALDKHRSTLKTVLHTGRDGLLIELPAKKKHQILYRLNNKTSLVV